MKTTTQAASASPSERIVQNALTAGRTESDDVRWSTRYEPATRRMTSSATPATMSPIAIARTSLRRLPGTSQSASRKGEEHRDPDPVRDRLEELRQALCGVELVRLQDRDATCVRWQLGGDVPQEAESIAELDDERVEVEHHVAVGRGEARRVALEHLDDLALRERRRRDEERLDAGPPEQLRRGPVDHLLPETRDRRGQRLEVRRQLLLELGRDVDVRVQLVDHRLRDLILDRRVRDQLLRGGTKRLRDRAPPA